MNNFGLDKNYGQLNFEEITVNDLVMISGGSGGFGIPSYPGDIGGFPGGFPGGYPPVGNPFSWGYFG